MTETVVRLLENKRGWLVENDCWLLGQTYSTITHFVIPASEGFWYQVDHGGLKRMTGCFLMNIVPL